MRITQASDNPKGKKLKYFIKHCFKDNAFMPKRLLCDAETHPGDAFLGTITVFSANERIQDYILAIALCCSDNYCSDL